MEWGRSNPFPLYLQDSSQTFFRASLSCLPSLHPPTPPSLNLMERLRFILLLSFSPDRSLVLVLYEVFLIECMTSNITYP